MNRVCSWCNRVVEEGEGPITHTICDSCKASMDSELEKEDHPVSFHIRRIPSYILSVFTFPLRGFARWD